MKPVKAESSQELTQTNGNIMVMMMSYLVNLCFDPSRPPWIISGLKEIFLKRHIVERTSKAEIRPKNRVRKRRVVGRI